MRKYSLRRRIDKLLGRHKPAPQPGVRKDVVEIPIAGDLQLVVYWKVLPHGRGPAMILDAPWAELAKFDCFGPDRGHFHFQPDYEKQQDFNTATAEEQILEAGEILRVRFADFLATHRYSARIELSDRLRDQLATAIEKGQGLMRNYLLKVAELRED